MGPKSFRFRSMVSAAVLAGALYAGGCGGDDRGGLCTAGATQACTCADGVTPGTRTCGAMGAFGACACGTPAPMVMGNQASQYVVAKLTLPTSSSQYAHDLDGDGTADNRLGSVIQAINSLDLGPQLNTDAAIDSGRVVLLLEQISTDPTQQSAMNAGVQLTRGQPKTTAPRFDGGDTFTVDPANLAGTLVGDIVAGAFTSQDPVSSAAPVELTLELPLVPGEDPVPLPITAARMTFTRTASGRLMPGQLNGAIRKTDIDALVLPAVASLITHEIQIGNMMLATFDVDGNGTVTAAELQGHALIEGLLAPDVAIFGAGGNFDPNPGAPNKDCLSLGVAFEAVGASF